MNNIYISPEGNPEVWGKKPEGYFTPKEWEDLKPQVNLSEPLTFEQIAAAKYAEIITKANSLRDQVRARYSLPEQDSFPQQEAGARAILVNPEIQGEPLSPVDLVRELADKEGSPATDFAQRIINNVTHATTATKAILLQQRAYETTLKKAETIEAVEDIEVEFIL